MPYLEKSPFVFDCQVCHTRCDGVSKGNYQFENDTSFAEIFEQMVINKINDDGRYAATKCEDKGYPDIAVFEKDGKLYTYLEIKVQQRTFMSVGNILPSSHLEPSETVVLNLSDLLRYFDIQDETGIPTSILWVLCNRPCILREDKQVFYYQTIDKLREIYRYYGNIRRFRRKSGVGDIVDGQHKGVTVNYHFSLKELQKWNTR